MLPFAKSGKEERERDKLRADLVKRGSQLRAELSAKGKALKDEQINRLEELKKSIDEAQALKDERDNIKKDAETLENAALEIYKEAQEEERATRQDTDSNDYLREAKEHFIRFDSNGNGVLEISEIQTRVQFDRNRDGAVSEEEAKFFLDQHDQVDFDKFITLCWPRIKPFLMLDAGLFKPPASAEELHGTEQDLDGEEENIDENREPLEPGREGEELEEEGEYEDEETGEGEVRLHMTHTHKSRTFLTKD